ncbi:MAG: DUF523 domain-containing protein [Acidimicrobiales bacterium]
MAAPGHLPTEAEIGAWPDFTPRAPIRVLVSACLTGVACGVDGTSYGAPFQHISRILDRPNVQVVAFCPEDFAFGTPRETPDIHEGNGGDVLDGRARVRSESGQDWTGPMLRAALAMLELAQDNRVHLALQTDISAACGSQVIYLGARSAHVYQAGHGVCTALLVRHGFKVVSQRDHRTLGYLLHKLDPTFRPVAAVRDHHETDWYVEHLAHDSRKAALAEAPPIQRQTC